MKSLRLALRQPTSLYKGGRIPPACLDGNPPPFTREAESLRLALRQPTSLYKGGKIPQACLDGDTHSFAREVKGARREKFNRYFLSYVFF